MPTQEWFANRKRVDVWLTTDEYARLKAHAQKQDRPVAYVLRQALITLLKKEKV